MTTSGPHQGGEMTDPDRSDVDRAMDRYADGDQQAFAVVYDAVAPRLTAYIRRSVGDPELARDILQQTFLHMHRARSTFVPGAAALPWAFAIARRLIIDGARTRRAQPEPEPLDGNLAAASGLGSEELVFAHEAARRIVSELARLPASQRQAFELLKEEGLSLKQVAGILGITVTAVKLRAHRAVVALRSILERDSRP
jgi:RNA polymerase sigma-70 factor (ECF subfamily)